MVAGHSTKKQRRYGYYVCGQAQRRGAASCPGQSIPAARIEGALLAGLGELEQELSPEDRLQFHQEHSGPLKTELHRSGVA